MQWVLWSSRISWLERTHRILGVQLLGKWKGKKEWRTTERTAESRNEEIKKRKIWKKKNIKGVQLNKIFPFYNLWSYTRVRVPFASKSCSAVTMKQHSEEWGGLWGWREGCRSQSHSALTTVWVLHEGWSFAILQSVTALKRVKIPPLLHVGWISTDLQAGSLGGQWWFWGEFPSFLWNWGFTSSMSKFHPLNWGVTDPWKGVGAEQETLELLLFRHQLLQSTLCIILNSGLFLYESDCLARLL